MRSLLHVSGDGLKVVDDDTKGLIVDQTIEKVSFCAPDRNYERGFSYICRDGTTRRWMCHGFIAIKESVSYILRLAISFVNQSWGEGGIESGGGPRNILLDLTQILLNNCV